METPKRLIYKIARIAATQLICFFLACYSGDGHCLMCKKFISFLYTQAPKCGSNNGTTLLQLVTESRNDFSFLLFILTKKRLFILIKSKNEK